MKRLRRHASELFAFLDHADVPFDNNHGESQIRPAVIARKNIYANGSEDGAETQAVLMTIFRTLKQRGHNPVSAVSARFAPISEPASDHPYRVPSARIVNVRCSDFLWGRP